MNATTETTTTTTKARRGTSRVAALALALAVPTPACAQSNALPLPPPAAAAAVPITWATNATSLRTQPGSVHTFRCPPAGAPGTVWGTDIYTDDSSICTAALHSGRVHLALGGVVQIQVVPGAQSYAGTLRNGVPTRAYAAFPGSFTVVGGAAPGLIAQPLAATATTPAPPPPPRPNEAWTKTAVHLRGRNGQSFTFSCPPGGAAARTIWGTDVYTDDSPVCVAAVHAGVITLAGGGSATIYIHPGRSRYAGSSRNSVTSTGYGAYPGSFAFVPRPPAPPGVPGAQTLEWNETGEQFRGRHGAAVRAFCPPGGTTATVWGSGPYTDDSSICTAAVHAGLITLAGGGLVTVRPQPGRARYAASSRNGVGTTAFGAFAGSFALSR